MLEKYQFWVLVQDGQQVGKEWYRKDSFLLLWMITVTTATASCSYYYYLGEIRGGWWGWGTSQYFVKWLHLRKTSCPIPTCLSIPQCIRTKTSEGEGSSTVLMTMVVRDRRCVANPVARIERDNGPASQVTPRFPSNLSSRPAKLAELSSRLWRTDKASVAINVRRKTKVSATSERARNAALSTSRQPTRPSTAPNSMSTSALHITVNVRGQDSSRHHPISVGCSSIIQK